NIRLVYRRRDSRGYEGAWRHRGGWLVICRRKWSIRQRCNGLERRSRRRIITLKPVARVGRHITDGSAVLQLRKMGKGYQGMDGHSNLVDHLSQSGNQGQSPFPWRAEQFFAKEISLM